jgi:hypothetical protein
MRKDLPINLPSLPYVCDDHTCACKLSEDGSEDMRVVFKASRAGAYEAAVRNEYGDLVDVVHGDDIMSVLLATHMAYPFANSATVENTKGARRETVNADDDLNVEADDDAA